MPLGSSAPGGHLGSRDGLLEEYYGVDPTLGAGLQRPIGWRVIKPDGTGAWDKTGAAATAWVPVAAGFGGVASFNGSVGIITYYPTVHVATIAALAALAASLANGYDSGSWAYVDSVRDLWQLQQSALAVDNITVVNDAGRAGFQWVRKLLPDPGNAAVTIWSVDPVNGNDENAGTGATAAAADLLAFKTLAEVKRRLWGLELTPAQVTVRILNSMVAGDVGSWNTKFKQGALFSIQGQLGAVTGPGPTAIDNTLYTGSLTSAPTVPADVPGADDYEIVDTAIPVSYTASGLLAAGVVFARTNGAARYWWPLKDLGAKTLRVTPPMSNLTALTTYGGGAMANADTYKAYQLRDFYNQDFGPSAIGVRIEQLYDRTVAAANLAESIGKATQRLRVDSGGTDTVNLSTQWTNCLIRLAGSRNVLNPGGGTGSLVGGGALGTGATVLTFFNGIYLTAGCWTSQGVALATNDGARVQHEREYAIHDTTVAMQQAVSPGSIIGVMIPSVGQGMSGKGNTGKILSCSTGASFYYGFSGAQPPFSTAVTTDATPITVGAVNYTVAQLPTVADTMLSPLLTFSPQQLDNLVHTGALVTSGIGATFTYMANPGTALAVANLAAQQRFPGGRRWMTGLRVTVRAGALTNNVTVTLYKNGVATAMVATVIAGDAAGTQRSDFTHPILFLEGDDYDLRMDDGADASAGTLVISAGLEYAA